VYPGITESYLNFFVCVSRYYRILFEFLCVCIQVLQNPIDDGLFGNTECAMLTFTPAQPHPVKYVFGEPPATTSRFQSSSNTVSTSLFPPGMHVSSDRRDVVRLMLLGNQPPELVRVCSRCCSASFASSQQRVLAKAPAMRVWELRFERSCVCGGQWMLETALSDR
jgi:Mediator complex subunit 16